MQNTVDVVMQRHVTMMTAVSPMQQKKLYQMTP